MDLVSDPRGPSRSQEPRSSSAQGGGRTLGGLSPHEVSLFVHLHYLRVHTKGGMRILHLGAPDGPVVGLLKEMGCKVLSLAVKGASYAFHRSVTPHLFSGDGERPDPPDLEVLDLTPVRESVVDAVVCFGGAFTLLFPDPAHAFGEFTRVCRPGGCVLLSVLSAWGALQGYLTGFREPLSGPDSELGDSGSQAPQGWKDLHDRLRPCRAMDLKAMAEKQGLEVLALSASNALSVGWGDFPHGVAETPSRLQELLRLELATCREEGCLDMGTHIILVGRKPGG